MISRTNYVGGLILLGIALNAPVARASQSSENRPLEPSENRSLESWIEQQLHFFPDVNGDRKLFIRQEPLRAAVHSEVPDVEGGIKTAIKLFSTASGVEHEFTAKDPNLIVFVASEIADGDSPNREFLKRIGLPDSAVEIVKDQRGWSRGCMIYSFAKPEGVVLLSLVLVDKMLPRTKIVDCTTDGIVRAFGLRADSRAVLSHQQGYLQYVLLVSVLKKCSSMSVASADRRNVEVLKRKYADCALEYIRSGISLK